MRRNPFSLILCLLLLHTVILSHVLPSENPTSDRLLLEDDNLSNLTERADHESATADSIDSSRLRLGERPPWYKEDVGKGSELNNLMRSSFDEVIAAMKQQPSYLEGFSIEHFTQRDFHQYGWVMSSDPPEDLDCDSLFEDKSLGFSSLIHEYPPNVAVRMSHSHIWQEVDKDTGKPKGELHEPTGARYKVIYNNLDGIIIITGAISTGLMMELTRGWRLNNYNPPLYQPDDLIMLGWQNPVIQKFATKYPSPKPDKIPHWDKKNLRYWLQPNVLSHETIAIALHIAALKQRGDWKLRPWDKGKLELDADSDEGKAIIGSPEGKALSWALISNKGLLGTKRISRVIIFAGDHARYSEGRVREEELNSEVFDKAGTTEELVSRSMLPHIFFIVENVVRTQDTPRTQGAASG